MEKDRRAIAGIIGQMLDSPDKDGIYETTKCYDRLEAYIWNVRVELNAERNKVLVAYARLICEWWPHLNERIRDDMAEVAVRFLAEDE